MSNTTTTTPATMYQVSDGTNYWSNHKDLAEAERMANKYQRSTGGMFYVKMLQWTTQEAYEADLVADTITTIYIAG